MSDAANERPAPTDPALNDTVERRRRRRERLADPDQPGFLPEAMDTSVIAIPLLDALDAEEEARATRPGDAAPGEYQRRRVIVDLNLEYKDGRTGARGRVEQLTRELAAQGFDAELLPRAAPEQYVFARMTGPAIRALARADAASGRATAEAGAQPVARDRLATQRAIYRIWPDFEVSALITKSVSTVKADAARSSFAAMGSEIVWAVVDSGVARHPHFELHHNLDLPSPLQHYDFTGGDDPHADGAGHGTHVAGIIAGEIAAARDANGDPRTRAYAVTRAWNEQSQITYTKVALPAISGMAPRCKVVSMRVLDAAGKGHVSDIIGALEQIQQLNGYGRRLLIHGVNLSVGYDFQPEWFACGQSPLCVEVDRLVRSGVVVVVAAGNTGYGFVSSQDRGTVAAGMSLSINDPGNAELAITVGSTHREMPHTYGVSYFSSKGPTGDGRLKPDVVAPGEKVLSCAAGQTRTKAEAQIGAAVAELYVEQSGTSMAAPHVSGIVAAFLSIRREFIGRPEEVKDLFVRTATDLRRDRYFQGAGLVDLMRAVQSV